VNVPTLNQRIARGEAVKALLENEAMQEVFELLETRGMQSFRAAMDDEARRNVWALLNGLDEIKRLLRAVTDDGAVAFEERKREEARTAR
jgi:transcription initiation factor IIE alpha subunit